MYKRQVNNNDIVTRFPPVILGYRHSGTEQYLDRHGRLRDIKGWRKTSDKLKGFFKELVMHFRIDHLGDHGIDDYIDTIFTLVRNERNKPAKTS